MLYNNICNKLKTKFLLRNVVHGTNISIRTPFYLWNKAVIIGDNCVIYPNVTLWGDGEIVIGNNVKLGHNVIIHSSSGGRIKIGDNTIIAANTYIINSNHQYKLGVLIQNQESEVSDVIIGEDCWISASCVIGRGAHVEDGAVIGAASFVNSRILSNSVAVGSPAKIIKERRR